jgi:hypothetical protein
VERSAKRVPATGLLLVLVAGLLFAGCSSAPPDDPAPKGTLPEIQQANPNDPNLKSPEERARGGGGEGS